MKFELNKNEKKKLKEFQQMCLQMEEYAFREENGIKSFTSNLHYRYIFSQTGIGVYCAVECTTLNVGINLTDYDSW